VRALVITLNTSATATASAAAAAAAVVRLVCAALLLTRLWRYCLSVLDREGPDEETLAAAA
jgi:hypothetical protein